MDIPRKVKDFTFEAGAQKTETLPTGRLLSLILRIAGNLVAGSGTTNPTLVQDAIGKILKSLKIEVGGKPVHNVTGDLLYLLAANLGIPAIAPPITTPAISGGNGASYAFAVDIPIDVAPEYSAVREAAHMALHQKLNPQAILEYAAASELYSGGDRTLSYSGVTVELFAQQTSTRVDPLIFLFMNMIRKLINGATDNFDMTLPYGRGLNYAGVMIRARLAGSRDNTVINKVELLGADDESLFGPISWTQLRERNLRQFKKTMDDGIAFLFWDKHRNFNGNLDTSKFGDLKFKFDVDAPSGTTDITLVPLAWRKIEAKVPA